VAGWLAGWVGVVTDTIFNEPTGYYSMKCFLVADYAVDKAIFIKVTINHISPPHPYLMHPSGRSFIPAHCDSLTVLLGWSVD
jgi:hypothetical protein